MKRIIRDEYGNPAVAVIASKAAKVRLSRTCFRGSLRAAGDFYGYSSIGGLLDDRHVKRPISAALREFLQDLPFSARTEFRCTIELGKPVGWASTIPRDLVNPCKCQEVWPNKNWHALKVMSEDIPAPLTNKLTIVLGLSHNRRGWDARVRAVFPGDDFGKLVGDLTRERGLVIFDFNHPGEQFARGRKNGIYWPERFERYRNALSGMTERSA